MLEVERAKAIELSGDLTFQTDGLMQRLQSNIFSERPKSSSRRADGEVVISAPDDAGDIKFQIRLNAFSFGRSAVVDLIQSNNSTFATGLMIRDSKMGGDDRGLVAIPQTITAESMHTVENLIYGACQCVARGTVMPGENTASSGEFKLFLPSVKPLPEFGPEFQIYGLKSHY